MWSQFTFMCYILVCSCLNAASNNCVNVILFFILGLGFSICDFISLVAIQVYFENNIVIGNNLLACGYEIGPAIFGPLIGLVSNAYGWRASMLVLSGICSIAYITCFILKPPPSGVNSHTRLIEEGNGCHNKSKHSYSVNSRITDSQEGANSLSYDAHLNKNKEISQTLDTNETTENNVWKDPIFWLLCVSIVCFMIHYLTGYMQITLKANDEGVSAHKGVWLFTTIALSAVIVRLSLTKIIKDFNVLIYSAGLAGIIASVASICMPLLATYLLLLIYGSIWGGCQGNVHESIPVANLYR